MKFTVIGYYGGSLKANSSASSYLIENEFGMVLIDSGPGSVSKLQERFNLNDIDHVIISHYHYDHFSDIGALIYARLINLGIGQINNPINIYTQNDGLIAQTLDMGQSTYIHHIDENSSFSIYGMKFDFMLTKHPVKCLAVRVRDEYASVVYTADTAYTEEIVDFAKNSDLLVLENSLYYMIDGENSGHMNTHDAARLINRSNAKQAILTHLPIYGDHQEILNSVCRNVKVPVHLAESFLSIEL